MSRERGSIRVTRTLRRGWSLVAAVTSLVAGALGLVLTTPGVADAVSVSLVSSAQPFFNVIDSGSSVWASTDVPCGTADNYVYQFNEAGQFVADFAVGAAQCDSPALATNGTDVAVVNGRTLYVLAPGQSPSEGSTALVAMTLSDGVHVTFDGSYVVVSDASTGLVAGYSTSAVLSGSSPAPAWTYVSVCAQAGALASDSGKLYVACDYPYSLFVIEPPASPSSPVTLVSTVALNNRPGPMGIDGSTVWILSLSGTELNGYSLSTLTPDGSITLGAYAGDLYLDGSTAWLTQSSPSQVDQVDLSTLSVVGSVSVPTSGYGGAVRVAGSGSNVWVADDNGNLYSFLAVAPSSTSLAAAGGATTDVYGTALQLTATVSTPGTVTFDDNGVAIAGCVAVAATTSATCTWTPGTTGAHTLSDSLTPSSSSYSPSVSTSDPVVQVAQAPSATALSLGPGVTRVTDSVTTDLTATVSTPGTVTFDDNGVAIAGCVAVAATTSATCTWTPAATGVQSLVATLTPTSVDYTGSSGALSVAVGALILPSSTSLAAAGGATTDVYGTALQLTATVSTPGTVTFDDNGVAIAGCVAVAATTSATCTWTPPGVGAQSLSASLAPSSSDWATSRSPAIAVSVAPASSTARVTVESGERVVRAIPVLVIATVSTPGTVTFVADGSPVAGCVGVPAPTTSAQCWWVPRDSGTTTVTASLAPESPDFATASAAVRVRVDAPQASWVVGPFVGESAAPSRRVDAAVQSVSALVAHDGYRVVIVVGAAGPSGGAEVSRERADVVRGILSRDLARRGVRGVRVVVAASGARTENVVVVGDY